MGYENLSEANSSTDYIRDAGVNVRYSAAEFVLYVKLD